MEYGLGRGEQHSCGFDHLCLNPCFNGIWSRTVAAIVAIVIYLCVLILVLMEYGLGLFQFARLELLDGTS